MTILGKPCYCQESVGKTRRQPSGNYQFCLKHGSHQPSSAMGFHQWKHLLIQQCKSISIIILFHYQEFICLVNSFYLTVPSFLFTTNV